MSRKRARWIHVEGWEKFQHYKTRRPPWIKNYVDLLNHDAYLQLTPHQRGILHGLWLLYSIKQEIDGSKPEIVGRQLGASIKMRDLESLNHAGFIRFSASKTLAPCKQDATPETEREEKTTSSLSPPNPLSPNGHVEVPAGTAPPTADAAAPQPATGPRKWQPGDPPV